MKNRTFDRFGDALSHMKIPAVKHSALVFLVLFLFLLVGDFTSLSAASTTGQVTAAGASPSQPVLGLSLTLIGHGPQMTTVTDANGSYTFTGLNSGEHGLRMKIRDALYFDVNKDVDLPTSGNAIVNVSLVPRLTLTALCSLNPSVSRHWSVHNPLPVAVNFQWVLKHPSNQTSSGVASPGDSTFDTPAVQGANLVQLLVGGTVVDQKNNPGQVCCTGSLSGSISDTTAAPLGNVQIAVIDSSANTVTTVFSQADGSYSATNLLAGTYSLAFTNTGYHSQTVAGIVVACNVSTSVPTVQLVSNAPPQMATVDVTVLENVTEAPINGATVSISYSSGTNPPSQTTDGNGLAHFDNQVVGVSATITVIVNDGSNRTATQTISGGFVVGANSVLIGINPIPRGSISGTVTNFYSGVPLGNVTIQLLDPSTALPIASGSTIADGTYAMGGVAVGTYDLSLSLSQYHSATVSSVTISNGANTVENITLTPLVPPQDATVDITVIDAGTLLGISGATVTIDYGEGSSSGAATTDGNGLAHFDSQVVGVSAAITVVVNDGSSRVASQNISNGFAVGPNGILISIAPVPH